jgi:copper chaperone CopZ
MKHTYKITGMTCSSCEEKVKRLLSAVDGVTYAEANLQKGLIEITMSKHVSTSVLHNALRETKYQLSEMQENLPQFMDDKPKSWFNTYKPVLLIFVYITTITIVAQVNAPEFSLQTWMRHFMAGFFLVFSFFKLLNLRGFADSYSSYDIIAKRLRTYAFIYAFIELLLGLLFLANVRPLLVNSTTFLVMSISLVGVLQSVLDKRKIRCACLGDIFNLPMSTLTIIEDALMILMSLVMIIHELF